MKKISLLPCYSVVTFFAFAVALAANALAVDPVYWDARWSGVDATDTLDDTAALNDARDAARAAKVPLLLPGGTIIISTPLTQTVKEMWQGQGAEDPAVNGTTLLWNGTPGSTMFTITNVEHNELKHIKFDGNNLAENCLIIDGACNGKYSNLRFQGYTTGTGLKTQATTHTMSWNTFTNIVSVATSSGNSCIWLSGSDGMGGNGNQDTCINTWINTAVLVFGKGSERPGIRLGYCDFNSFFHTFAYTGTNPGVLVDPSETDNGVRPNGNVFYTLTGKWVQLPGLNPFTRNRIYQYDKGENHADPDLGGATASLDWDDNWGRLNTTNNLNLAGGDGTNELSVFLRPTTSGSNAGQFALLTTDYSSSFKASYLRQYNTGTPGTTAGISNSFLATLTGQNVSTLLLHTNNGAPIVLSSGGTPQLRIETSGVTLGNGGTPITKIMSGYVPWDIATVAAGGGTSIDVTFNGVGVDDTLVITPSGYYGILGISYLASDTVRLQYYNVTGSSQNPPSRNFRIEAIKH